MVHEVLLKFLKPLYKIYFYRRHCCILCTGLQIFFIYKKFPHQSKIYIYSEEI